MRSPRRLPQPHGLIPVAAAYSRRHAHPATHGRRMSLGVHRGLELLVGVTILAVPLVLSATTTEVGGAGVAVCVALGALVAGAALHAEDAPSLHSSVDRLLLGGLSP